MNKMLLDIHEEVNLRTLNNLHHEASNKLNSQTSELSFYAYKKDKNQYEVARQVSANRS